jgi:hypothetical protein
VPAACGGKPADLHRAELAVMYLDAQGGSADPARAWALLRGCADDKTLFDLHRSFADRAPTGTFELCREIDGTPTLFLECRQVEAALAAQARGVTARRVRSRLPAAVRAPFDRAEAAWSRFLQAEAARVVARVLTPGADALVRATTVAALERERAAWLESLPGRGVTPCPARDRDRDMARMKRARLDASSGVGPAALDGSDKAWTTYRDAEARWLGRWRGRAARSSASCSMTQQRARMLEVHEPEDVAAAAE